MGKSFAAVKGMIICFFVFDVVELRADLNIHELEALFKLPASILPNNLVAPFVNGGTLQIAIPAAD